jgi:hypothetical protein
VLPTLDRKIQPLKEKNRPSNKSDFLKAFAAADENFVIYVYVAGKRIIFLGLSHNKKE